MFQVKILFQTKIKIFFKTIIKNYIFKENKNAGYISRAKHMLLKLPTSCMFTKARIHFFRTGQCSQGVADLSPEKKRFRLCSESSAMKASPRSLTLVSFLLLLLLRLTIHTRAEVITLTADTFSDKVTTPKIKSLIYLLTPSISLFALNITCQISTAFFIAWKCLISEP